MANTGWIDASNTHISFRGISDIASIGTNSVKTTELARNGGTAYFSIDIQNALIQNGTITKVIVKGYSYGDGKVGANGTLKTGFVNSNGDYTWVNTHDKSMGNNSSSAEDFEDTITKDNNNLHRSNEGIYRIAFTVINTILLLKEEYTIDRISIYIEYDPPSYTATFKNYDGTVLQNVSVQSGSTPSYTGATPTKPQDVQYTYEFSGWSPALGAITANTTYTAQFKATLRKYKITIDQPEHGTITGAVGGEYEYGTKLILTATPNEGYYFDGWLLEYWNDTSLNMYDNPLEFIVLGEEIISARIFKKQATIILTLDDTYGSVTGVAVGEDGTETNLSIGENIVDVGTEITLTATPNKGYVAIMRVLVDEEDGNIVSILPGDHETNSISFTVLDKGTQKIQVNFVVQSIRNIQIGTSYLDLLCYDEQTKTVYFVVDEYIEIEPTGADTVDGLNFAVTTFEDLPKNAKPIIGVQIGTRYVFKD